MRDFSDFEIDSLGGEPDLLGSLRGEVVLVVNVASECGYTSQYKGLQDLHQDLHAEGFSVVGLPCNQFGAQEPGSPAQIIEFCQSRFGVTFPLGVKIEVNGPDRHPLYAWLTSSENGHPGDISWNFEKFLIGRNGQLIARYPPATEPGDPVLLQDIAEALVAQ
jgi:glutathione peroxidase